MTATQLLLVQAAHDPSMHGAIVTMVLVAVVLVGGLGWLARKGRRGPERGSGSGRDVGSDRGRGA